MPLVRQRHRAALVALVVTVLTFPTAAKAQDQKVVTPAFDFSGVIFANWQQRSDSATKAVNGGQATNKFDVERAYLTFKMPAGDRASIRVTTDLFNSGVGGGNWTIRLKYAYLQWNFANDIGGTKGFNALARFGVVHTVLIDHVEGFWPRYLGTSGTDRNSFFSSADAGAAVLVNLPNKMGEVYWTLTNGSGYSTGEGDRFKDFAARVSLTPLGNSTSLFKTLTISPWFYDGSAGSKFFNGGAGQVGAVTDGLTKTRYGVFVGNKDPKLSLGVDWAMRTDQTEGGLNTTASPRTTTDVKGSLLSLFAIVRPGAFADPKGPMSRWGLVGRLDTFTPNTDANGKPANQFITAGAFLDLTSKVTMSLDVQNQTRKSGSTTPESKLLFLHFQAAF